MKLEWNADPKDLVYVKAEASPWTFKMTTKEAHPDLGTLVTTIAVGENLQMTFQQNGNVGDLRDIAELLADYKLVKKEDA